MYAYIYYIYIHIYIYTYGSQLGQPPAWGHIDCENSSHTYSSHIKNIKVELRISTASVFWDRWAGRCRLCCRPCRRDR